MTTNRMNLTSSELACIWTGYMNNSMAKCMLGYFLKDVRDEEMKAVFQFAYDIANSHTKQLTQLFNKEQLPLPVGFTIENDVNMNAPPLYTDMFILTYINHMAKVGLLAYSGFSAMSTRKDIRDHFIIGLQEISDLFDKSTEVALSKGLYVRAPYIPYPTRIDFVDSKSYLSGFSLFNKKRPLNSVEISHLFMNIQTNIIGNKLAQSFAQTSPREDVQKWMFRGADISKKHVKIFTSTLLNNNIQPPISPDLSITNSTTPPFSDKLTLFHMSLLSGAGTGNYASAAAASQRSDLFISYERLSLEIAQYAKDGADLMIRNEWLEQPPGTIDQQKLTKTKDTE